MTSIQSFYLRTITKFRRSSVLLKNMSFGSSSSQSNHPCVPDNLRRDLVSEARCRKKRKIAYFNGPRGTLIRSQVPNYIRMLLQKDTRCGLCNVNNSRDFVSKKTNVKYRTCGVPLSNEPHFWRTSCLMEWHSTPDLFQRVNYLSQPRRR